MGPFLGELRGSPHVRCLPSLFIPLRKSRLPILSELPRTHPPREAEDRARLSISRLCRLRSRDLTRVIGMPEARRRALVTDVCMYIRGDDDVHNVMDLCDPLVICRSYGVTAREAQIEKAANIGIFTSMHRIAMPNDACAFFPSARNPERLIRVARAI
jgi:hypothetical protein